MTGESVELCMAQTEGDDMDAYAVPNQRGTQSGHFALCARG